MELQFCVDEGIADTKAATTCAMESEEIAEYTAFFRGRLGGTIALG